MFFTYMREFCEQTRMFLKNCVLVVSCLQTRICSVKNRDVPIDMSRGFFFWYFHPIIWIILMSSYRKMVLPGGRVKIYIMRRILLLRLTAKEVAFYF